MLAAGSDTDKGDRSAERPFDEGDIGEGVGGELVTRLGGGGGLQPPLENFVVWRDLGKEVVAGGEVVEGDVVEAIRGANLDFVEGIQNVEEGQGDLSDAIETGDVAGGDGVEPSGPAGAAGGGAVFASALADSRTGLVMKFGRERTTTDAGAIRLKDGEHALHLGGGDASALAGTCGGGGRRCDEGVGAVVYIEHGALSALDEEVLSSRQRVLDEDFGRDDVLSKSISKADKVAVDGAEVEFGCPVDAVQNAVLFVDLAAELAEEGIPIEKVGDADAAAGHLVRIGRSVSAQRGADLVVSA